MDKLKIQAGITRFAVVDFLGFGEAMELMGIIATVGYDFAGAGPSQNLPLHRSTSVPAGQSQR
jgi:hypothetical protein